MRAHWSDSCAHGAHDDLGLNLRLNPGPDRFNSVTTIRHRRTRMPHQVLLNRLARFTRLGPRSAETASAFSSVLIAFFLWGLSGLLFHFSDGWQRVVATGTAVAALVVVLDLKRTLNREVSALKRKGPPPLPKMPQERDRGYGTSHGYSPGHGGPSGPGDAPARLPPPPPPPLRRPPSGSVAPSRRDGRP
jgi:Low affinity iron permease